jgi:hypothetical protein
MNKINYDYSFSELIELLSILQIKQIKFNKENKKYAKIIESVSLQLRNNLKKINKKNKLNANLIAQLNFISISNLEIWNLKNKMLNDKKNYLFLLYRAMELNCIRNIIANNISKKFNYNDQTKIKISFFTKKETKNFKQMKKFYTTIKS